MPKLATRDFDLPVARIRKGWFSDSYFVRTQQILECEKHHPQVVMQIFCKKAAFLCGVREAAACLVRGSHHPRHFVVDTLKDGDRIRPWETVMHITGDYAAFASLETLYLGILARRTSLATAVRRVVDAAKGKPVLFFSARFDHYLMQPGDGYAAFVGGATGVSSEGNTAWVKGREPVGTIPHGLVAAYGGDTVKACLAFDRRMPVSVKRVALVDFDNDCVKTSLEVARALGKRLWGVRLDTAREIRDASVRGRGPESYGVSAELVRNVRRSLDREGFRWVRIVVSGGFNAEKVKKFVAEGVPFDAVGIGSAFLHERIEFTADIVKVGGGRCAMVGRSFRGNRRLRRVA